MRKKGLVETMVRYKSDRLQSVLSTRELLFRQHAIRAVHCGYERASGCYGILVLRPQVLSEKLR